MGNQDGARVVVARREADVLRPVPVFALD
jgi:hypothetical protein